MQKHNLLISLILLLPAFIMTSCGQKNAGDKELSEEVKDDGSLRNSKDFTLLDDAEDKVSQTWANVQASYQRMFDLIPNLVETVKGYAAHESSTLEKVTALRTQGDSLLSVVHNPATPGSGTVTSIEQMEDLNRRMSLYINAVHEAYPNLKASENFLSLLCQLESIENRIYTARNQYNAAVNEYNELIKDYIKKHPNNKYKFHPKELLKPSQEAQSTPEVKF